MRKGIVRSGIQNYYGEIEAWILDIKDKRRYFCNLEDWGSTSEKEVSKEFYDAFVKEFTGKLRRE